MTCDRAGPHVILIVSLPPVAEADDQGHCSDDQGENAEENDEANKLFEHLFSDLSRVPLYLKLTTKLYNLKIKMSSLPLDSSSV